MRSTRASALTPSQVARSMPAPLTSWWFFARCQSEFDLRMRGSRGAAMVQSMHSEAATFFDDLRRRAGKRMGRMSDLTIANVAAVLQVHVDTVRRLARKRKLRGYTVGGRWRFEPSAIDEFRAEANRIAQPEPQTPQLRIVNQRPVRRSSRLPGWNRRVER